MLQAVEEMPAEVLGLATIYLLPELAEACRAAVVAALTPENALRSLVDINRYKETEDDRDKVAIFEFIKKNRRNVIKSPDWPLFNQGNETLMAEIMMAL